MSTTSERYMKYEPLWSDMHNMTVRFLGWANPPHTLAVVCHVHSLKHMGLIPSSKLRRIEEKDLPTINPSLSFVEACDQVRKEMRDDSEGLQNTGSSADSL